MKSEGFLGWCITLMVMMPGMYSPIFVNDFVVRAILLAAGLFAVVFFVIGAIHSCVMFFPIFVDGFVVRAVLFAVGFFAVVLFVVRTINPVIPALIVTLVVLVASVGKGGTA